MKYDLTLEHDGAQMHPITKHVIGRGELKVKESIIVVVIPTDTTINVSKS